MLNSIYNHALENRERLLAALDKDVDKIVGRARQSWNVFESSQAKTPKTLGIDGSYNSTRYQGVDFWIAGSVAARPDGEPEVQIPPEMGFERNSQPREAMQSLEIEACAEAVNRSELILMDGSLLSVLITGISDSRKNLIRLVRDNANKIVFVSKTSDVNYEFGAMVGDIYYYNKASRECGFSDILVKEFPDDGLLLSSTYIRLAHSAPLVKVEMLGEIKNEDVKDLIAKLSEQSIGGYPNALRQAHRLCTITNEDVEKIVMVIGVRDVVGAREVLN